MKTRFYLSTVLSFLLLASSAGQEGRFYAGIKSGFGIPSLTASGVSTPLSEGFASRLGYYGGLVSELRTGDHFGIRAEVNFSSQGGRRDGLQAMPLLGMLEPLWQMLPQFGFHVDGFMYADIESRAILNYIEVPVMAKYRFHISRKIDFYLQAGPYAGFLMNAKLVTAGKSHIYADSNGMYSVDQILQLASQDPIGEVSFDHTENITPEIHKFNLGGQGAAGFGMKMRSGELFLEGGGNYGFLKIQKDEANGTNNTGAGTVTLGYLLFL